MKFKWKIILSSVGVILALALSIVLFTRSEISNLVYYEIREELQNYSNMGLRLFDRVYDGEWSIVDGKLYKGNAQINENYELIDDFTKGTEVLLTVFQDDMRAATNVVNENGQRIIGTQAAKEVTERVINQGKPYLGVADVLGKSVHTYYEPIRDSSGAIIGMWSVGIYTDVVSKKIDNTILMIVLFAGVLAAAGMIISYILGSVLAKSIKLVQDRLHMMEEGKFDFRFDERLLNRRDELVMMAQSAKNMQKRVADIIKTIQLESENVKVMTEKSLKSMEQAHEGIEVISATTEELSSGIEETSASTEQMRDFTYEIESKVSNMEERTLQGEHLADEIKQRAEKLKGETDVSYQNALDIYDRTNVQLRESIKRTEAIEEIGELSKTILDITSRTNLLALNAAIEAARAGEAGKGFAVVADEIRVLATNSKNAVSRINDIINNVSGAVENVVEDSKALLEFVDNQVLKDYKMLVNTSLQYAQDADKVQEVITEINNIAGEIYSKIQIMRHAIDEIATSVGEGAVGNADIAAKIADIVSQTDDVLRQIIENRKSVERLDEMVGFFQIVEHSEVM
ncbi:cache domain-containing protein [Pseudoclostridium thermosuccinogenes]|uniref:methyl-accepting chemotaxis protein n=1 Tax=Clostridium thermosuccinogenes TaxID=84032 RepID=UPI002FD9B9BD